MNEKFTAKKAQFLNLQQDGLKLRSSKFKNKKAYDRKSFKNKSSW